jgi:hypothetical protein
MTQLKRFSAVGNPKALVGELRSPTNVEWGDANSKQLDFRRLLIPAT